MSLINKMTECYKAHPMLTTHPVANHIHIRLASPTKIEIEGRDIYEKSTDEGLCKQINNLPRLMEKMTTRVAVSNQLVETSQKWTLDLSKNFVCKDESFGGLIDGTTVTANTEYVVWIKANERGRTDDLECLNMEVSNTNSPLEFNSFFMTRAPSEDVLIDKDVSPGDAYSVNVQNGYVYHVPSRVQFIDNGNIHATGICMYRSASTVSIVLDTDIETNAISVGETYKFRQVSNHRPKNTLTGEEFIKHCEPLFSFKTNAFGELEARSVTGGFHFNDIQNYRY